MEEDHAEDKTEVQTNVILALNLVGSRMKIRTKTSKVLKANETDYDPSRKIIIGGDTRDFSKDRHPAIIIEKENDQMSKIIVRCPCGRHSELICEYDEEIPQTDSEPEEPESVEPDLDTEQ